MKKSITSYSNSSVIISLYLILFGTAMVAPVSKCYAQSPWTQKTDMPTGRWELSTCVVDGKIYAIGGAGPVWQALRTVEEYDPATDTWTTKSEMSTARQGLSTSVVNGKIYAIGGGAGSSKSYNPTETFSTVEEYDPATDTWTTKTEMPAARGFHSANVLDGKIYIVGGSSALPDNAVILAVEVYDPVTDTWTQKGNIPRSIGSGSTSVVDGKIYAFGGYGGLEKVHEYDPVTDTWIQKAEMPTRRVGLSTSVLDGKIYAIGGHPGSSPYPALATVEVYDPATDTWTTTIDLLTGRCGVRTSVVNGKIYAIGGYMGTWISRMCLTVEEYDPSKDLKGLVKNVYTGKSFAVAGSDSVCITAKMSDPTGITLLAEIEAPDQIPVDSMLLFDDGNHNDGNPGDSLYANVWAVSSTKERKYYVDLHVTRFDEDTVIHHINNMVLFTTIGPVVFEEYNIASGDITPNPGDRIQFELTLRNNGTTAIATDITAVLTSLDTLGSMGGYNLKYFENIAPGEVEVSKLDYTIDISENCPINYEIPFKVDIYSDNYKFWSDTFSIMVEEPPVNIKDTRESKTNIYPNPTNDLLTIETEYPDHHSIEITSLNGQLMYSTRMVGSSHQIDLSSFHKGVYFITIRSKDFVTTRKIVKL